MKQFQQYTNWIICLDPDSRQIYSTNGDIIIIETHVDPQYKQKCENALQDMCYILYNHENVAHWLQDSSEVEQYRRRNIPSYLLHPKQQQYRRYLLESNMGFSFSNIYTIKFNIICQCQNDLLNGKQTKIEFNLMTSADEAIQMILKQLQYQMSNLHQYILQVDGYQEYIYGEQPLLQFTRIRNIIRDSQVLNTILIDYMPSNNFDYPPIYKRPKDNYDLIEDWKNYLEIPVFIWYPKQKIVNQQISILKQNRIVNDLDFIYSGQCDFFFSFKIIKIDQLKNLFESDFDRLGKKRSTYNGTTKLNNITKNQPSKINKNKDILMFHRKETQQDEPYIPIRYVSFGGVENRNYIKQMQTLFNLNFEPYLISIEASIYYGDKLLTNSSIIESQLIPFSFTPTFNATIKFSQIKYSMLPLEVKLCFRVLIYSFNGESQILGSTSMYLFDQNSKFKQGLQTLNLWPFYDINPKIGCFQDFKGEINLDNNYKRCRPKCYSYLSIKMDCFSSQMKWSLRDQKFQQFHQGSLKDCLNVKHYADLVRSDPELQKQIETKKNYHYVKDHRIQLDLDKTTGSIISQNKRKGISILQNIDSQRSSNFSQLARNSLNNFLQYFISNRMTANYYKENSDRFGLAYPYKDIDQTPKTEDLAYLQTLLSATSLDRVHYTQLDKFLLMICRHHYKTLPYALQLFLKAVNWADPKQVREAHQMIKEWIPLPPQIALILMDSHFPDEIVRLYAVDRISLLSDDELSLYLLQLSQALQFEKNIYNPLGELLLERASANPFQIGQELFWLLKSQLNLKPSFLRYFIWLEQLIMICGQFRETIVKEVRLNNLLIESSLKIKSKQVGTEMQQKTDALKKELQIITQNIVQPFTFPIDARMQIASFEIDQCKVLNSKKLPLKLYLKSYQKSINQQINQLQVIFKNGDDLKQDMLTLQIIKIIDTIWLDSGLDFKMKPYKVIATDDQVGMIEVVLDSLNISEIHDNIGAFGAFDEKALINYLHQQNQNPEDFNRSKDIFLRSCAGYCVATYVLGIGDRHSGNIMIKSSGHIFHIDFGHFLGNFKIKFGINRERAKFVLTPEMLTVMGGQDSETFRQFEKHCLDAYNLIRKHGRWLVDLFLMNLTAGIPELQNAEDVRYLQDRLALNLSEQEAIMKFRQEIITSINDKWRRVDNFFHTLKRKG
ncbi:unnamed protein product [Paramecium primaurelia]|uniref:phosphatidylinositol 3-kinase n=1 Tax=Paramecium primaurelia TaxID=5886 RepID=A0A8S1LME8_PARPR|nr:unnamed protein product [Paramecium primaurelia]